MSGNPTQNRSEDCDFAGKKRRHDGSPVTEEGERLEKMARLVVEEAMTRAVVRKCWLCKKRFVRAGGCNTVRCSCGAKTCYICRGAVSSSIWHSMDHFWCFQDVKDHRQVQRAAENARANLRALYPGLTFKDLPDDRE